jgi:hypothetical protein
VRPSLFAWPIVMVATYVHQGAFDGHPLTIQADLTPPLTCPSAWSVPTGRLIAAIAATNKGGGNNGDRRTK